MTHSFFEGDLPLHCHNKETGAVRSFLAEKTQDALAACLLDSDREAINKFQRIIESCFDLQKDIPHVANREVVVKFGHLVSIEPAFLDSELDTTLTLDRFASAAKFQEPNVIVLGSLWFTDSQNKPLTLEHFLDLLNDAQQHTLRKILFEATLVVFEELFHVIDHLNNLPRGDRLVSEAEVRVVQYLYQYGFELEDTAFITRYHGIRQAELERLKQSS